MSLLNKVFPRPSSTTPTYSGTERHVESLGECSRVDWGCNKLADIPLVSYGITHCSALIIFGKDNYLGLVHILGDNHSILSGEITRQNIDDLLQDGFNTP